MTFQYDVTVAGFMLFQLVWGLCAAGLRFRSAVNRDGLIKQTVKHGDNPRSVRGMEFILHWIIHKSSLQLYRPLGHQQQAILKI